MIKVEDFTKALADQTRLRLLMLLSTGKELCVCEFTQILELSQPKISRHLAILRENNLLQDRKSGLWVYYCLHSELPEWISNILLELQAGSENDAVFLADQKRLLHVIQKADICTSSE